MASLTLLIMFVVVGLVYRWHARVSPYPSATLWLPSLWILRCGSKGIDYWMGGGELGRLDPIFVALMLVGGLVVLSRRQCQWGAVLAGNWTVFLFYSYMVMSSLWSESIDNPFIKLLRPICDLVMALIVTTEPDPRGAIAVLFRRCGILLIPLSIVLIRYFHNLGTIQSKHWGKDMWIGAATHKNPLGQLCLAAFIGFFLYLVDLRHKGKPILRQYVVGAYLLMALYLINGDGHSRSSTSILCLALALGTFVILGRMGSRRETISRRLAGGLAAVIALGVLLDLMGSSLTALVSASQGKDATLSDRTYLWRDVVRLGSRHALLGTGYGSFWVPSVYDQLSPEVDNRPAQCHNGYLETWVNLGFVGVGLLGLVILNTVFSALRIIHTEFEYGRLRLSLLFAVLLMNYTEATFPRGTHLWWFGFLIIAIYARPWVYWPEEDDAYFTEAEEHPAQLAEAHGLRV